MNIRPVLLVLAVAMALVAVGYSVHRWYARSKMLYVVNVLDRELFNECHIRGSVNVPFPRVKSWARSIPKDAHIVFYCSNYLCSASGQAARMLSQRGFSNVYAYEAGMHEWYQAGLPAVCTVESAYLAADNPKIDVMHDGVVVLDTDELMNLMIRHGFFE